MGRHETVTAEISDEMASAVREAVAAGDFASVEDVVRHALTEWRIAERMPKIDQGQLKAMLEDGLEGPARSADEVFGRLEAKYATMAEARELGD